MPQRSEFEEKEFEGPLYHEMVRSDGHLWTPGQVLEGHLGFDAAVAVVTSYWQHVQRMPMPGVVLATYGLLPMLPVPQQSMQLPTFALSLFVQAKRPWCFKRRPSSAVTHGLTHPCRCFYLDLDQQELLETLTQHLTGVAEVTYACACFHSKADLFDHTSKGTIIENSTFPPVDALSAHGRWLFDRPGAVGVAESDPEFVEAKGLNERLVRLAREVRGGVGRANRLVLANELHRIWIALMVALRHEASAKRAHDEGDYAGRILQVAEGVEDSGLPALEARLYQISVVLGMLGILWLVVGPTPRESVEP